MSCVQLQFKHVRKSNYVRCANAAHSALMTSALLFVATVGSSCTNETQAPQSQPPTMPSAPESALPSNDADVPNEPTDAIRLRPRRAPTAIESGDSSSSTASMGNATPRASGEPPDSPPPPAAT